MTIEKLMTKGVKRWFSGLDRKWLYIDYVDGREIWHKQSNGLYCLYARMTVNRSGDLVESY